MPPHSVVFCEFKNCILQGDKNGNNNPKGEDGNQPKDEDGAPQNKGQGDEAQGKPKDVDGNAYEAEPLPDGNNVPDILTLYNQKNK